MIVPETSYDSEGTASADVSQTYPMYVVYSYEENKIIANLYRVINIKKESITSEYKAKVTEFSETAFSTNKMYSERLVISPDGDFYKNYWFIDDDFLAISPGVNSQGKVIDLQRCIASDLE